eukprot:g2518.t1 g2518   contig12:277885-278814(-)
MARHQIQRLWGVAPILTSNFREAGVVNSEFNNVLTRAAMEAFDDFTNSTVVQNDRGSSSSTKRDSISPNASRRRVRPRSLPRTSIQPSDMIHRDSNVNPSTTPNDNFFEYQRTRGYHLATPSISNCKSVHSLHEEYLVDSITYYLHYAINSTSLANQLSLSGIGGEFSIDLWAAIQQGKGAYHEFHVHKGAIVSGVYYSSCPVGCAPLVLRKPDEDTLQSLDREGRVEQEQVKTNIILECIEGDVVIQPNEGQLVLFPPWVEHGVPLAVEPDNGREVIDMHQPRVSWAFNLTGRLAAIGNPWDLTRQFQ